MTSGLGCAAGGAPPSARAVWGPVTADLLRALAAHGHSCRSCRGPPRETGYQEPASGTCSTGCGEHCSAQYGQSSALRVFSYGSHIIKLESTVEWTYNSSRVSRCVASRGFIMCPSDLNSTVRQWLLTSLLRHEGVTVKQLPIQCSLDKSWGPLAILDCCP